MLHFYFQEEATLMIREADMDRDGKVNYSGSLLEILLIFISYRFYIIWDTENTSPC